MSKLKFKWNGKQAGHLKVALFRKRNEGYSSSRRTFNVYMSRRWRRMGRRFKSGGLSCLGFDLKLIEVLLKKLFNMLKPRPLNCLRISHWGGVISGSNFGSLIEEEWSAEAIRSPEHVFVQAIEVNQSVVWVREMVVHGTYIPWYWWNTPLPHQQHQTTRTLVSPSLCCTAFLFD